jgi:Ca2+-binding EF-hand superfamily protein
VKAVQTKETTGKATKGTRVMELRDREKGGFIDEIIFSARLPAELVDEEDEFDEMDTDGDGVISREEFAAAQALADDEE